MNKEDNLQNPTVTVNPREEIQSVPGLVSLSLNLLMLMGRIICCHTIWKDENFSATMFSLSIVSVSPIIEFCLNNAIC